MFGVLLAYLKRRDVGGTYLESHVIWQTRTFWIWLALWLAGWFTVILVVGWLLLGLAYVWLIYRIIKGWMLLADARPIERPESFFRSEERRVGKECVSTCRSRGSTDR